MTSEIIPRSVWDTTRPAGLTLLDPAAVRGLALHWPGDATVYAGRPLSWTYAVLRAFETWHREHQGWADIAYQVAVTQEGLLIECRGLQFRSAANGDAGANRTWGAVLLLLGTGETPTPAMVSAVARLRNGAWRARGYGLTVTAHSTIRPAGTQCPGDKVRALIARRAFDQEDEVMDQDTFNARLRAALKAEDIATALGDAVTKTKNIAKVGVEIRRSPGQLLAEIESDGEHAKRDAAAAAAGIADLRTWLTGELEQLRAALTAITLDSELVDGSATIDVGSATIDVDALAAAILEQLLARLAPRT